MPKSQPEVAFSSPAGGGNAPRADGTTRGAAIALLREVTAGGVPDTYRGTELIDLSLVDPDNRRPVDWDARRGAEELVDAYREIGLTHEAFEGRPYTRLKQLRYLLDERRIDDDLRWVSR